MKKQRLFFTHHAWKRMLQRDITPDEVLLVYKFGQFIGCEEKIGLTDTSINLAKKNGYAIAHLKVIVLIVHNETVITVIKKGGVV